MAVHIGIHIIIKLAIIIKLYNNMTRAIFIEQFKLFYTSVEKAGKLFNQIPHLCYLHQQLWYNKKELIVRFCKQVEQLEINKFKNMFFKLQEINEKIKIFSCLQSMQNLVCLFVYKIYFYIQIYLNNKYKYILIIRKNIPYYWAIILLFSIYYYCSYYDYYWAIIYLFIC